MSVLCDAVHIVCNSLVVAVTARPRMMQRLSEASCLCAADVLTIENSRSGDAMLRALAAAGYGRDVGPGVYDVHSPVVPSATFVKSKVDSFLAANVAGGDARRIWINPDCGLKTRGWAEVLPSLRNMVAAATELRASVAAH